MIFYVVVLLFPAQQEFSAWATVSPAFWQPIWLFRVLHLGVPWTAGLLGALALVWRLSLVLSVVGLVTRLSTATAFVLGTYLLGLPQNFGKTHHFDAYVVVILGVLACSRCGDRCSLDALRWRSRPDAPETRARAEASGAYTWPIRMACVVVACVFFAAGAAKLRYGGLAWITSDNMARLLVAHGYPLANADPLTAWGPRLAAVPLVPHFLAASTVLIEVLYPLALVSHLARWVLVPGGVLLVLGIRGLMGPTFETLALCALFWVPWDRAVTAVGHASSRRLAGVGSGPHAPEVILYDGTCGLCQGFVRFVLRHDRREGFRFAALQGSFAGPVLARHGVAPSSPETIYVVLGAGTPTERLLARSRAVLHVIGGLESPWPLLTVLGTLPAAVLDVAYRLVARHRFRLTSRQDTCPLPDSTTPGKFLDLERDAAGREGPGRAL